MTASQRRSFLISLGIIFCALVLVFAPKNLLTRQITVVHGSELQQILGTLKQKFEQSHPGIKIELKPEGSKDIVNNYIDRKLDYKPTVLIPADGELLTELQTRWRSQNSEELFYGQPRPIAKTQLVAIAWPERGKLLFPNGQFSWQRLEQALQLGDWGRLGGPASWGSFDLLLTDPTRSNSGQRGLYLWASEKLGNLPNVNQLNQPEMTDLLRLIKRSVYLPPRSTDVLLQEFIARGVNQADVALVYESIALSRWRESQTSQGKPYEIYYLNTTLSSIPTAAVLKPDVDDGEAAAAKEFLDFLNQPAQQEVFVQYGFRPVSANLDVSQVNGSPWQQKIPGSQAKPSVQVLPTPEPEVLDEIVRQWGRAN